MKFTKKIPIRVENCPILESIVEVRFKPNVDKSAVFGILYNKLREIYKNPVSRLPILEIPDNMRSNDPNLEYKPYYRLQNEDGVCQIGPDTISILRKDPYNGWSNYSENIYNHLDILSEQNVVDEVMRLGIRYINFLPDIRLNETELDIHLTGDTVNDAVILVNFDYEDFSNKLNINTTAKHKGVNGLIIDIDTVYSGSLSNFFENRNEIIESGHDLEKKIFFNSLKDSLIEKMQPEWQNY